MPVLLSVPLVFDWPDEEPRTGEPVSLGLPWPRGLAIDDRYFHLMNSDGRQELLQTRVLDRWPDGSIRWCLFDFIVNRDFSPPDYRLQLERTARAVETPAPIVEPIRTLDFGRLHLSVQENELFILRGEQKSQLSINCVMAEPDALAVWDFEARQIEEGPVRSRVRFSGPLVGSAYWSGKLHLWCELDFYAHSPVVRATVSLRNTLPADHPGGNWDLGNGGSVYLQELTLKIQLTGEAGECKIALNSGVKPLLLQPGQTLIQHSSGGENWQSLNHLDRKRELPTVRGYTLQQGETTHTGNRSTPVLVREAGSAVVGCAMPHFWQNFPKSLQAETDGFSLGLFPRQTGSPHELQGGEQKTHTVFLAFGEDEITREPLAWCRQPVLVHAAPEWYCQSGAIPYLTPAATDSNKQYLSLVNLALDGNDTFEQKREKIDEYGWRHFGDIYGDHEAVYWKGNSPMISHYNNQYDCVAGMLYQFFRSGRAAWYAQALQCADHTVDIDQYHTHDDKAAYNHGLFWHTYHYAPADTGNHRSYPKSLRTGGHFDAGQDLQKMGQTGASLQKAYAVGGGPASSHNYNAGLMLAYFLTGEVRYRNSAIDLAQFVLDMEDPLRTPFRWLSAESTGLATESGGGGYHGPGRASANSLLALLVGHQLTQESKFLTKAEEIIRRVVHPKQNLDRLELLNAELRWYYTMFLQALGKYLDYKIERNQLDSMYDYGRRCLLHYANWMAVHERPILDNSDALQYPTETWAAQDMRKVEVFQFAAKHVEGETRAKLLERADWFFRYVESKLNEFPTKSLCRPVILMLNFGWSRAWWQTNTPPVAPDPQTPLSDSQLGTWQMFTPQKSIAIRRAKRIILLGGAAFVLALAGLIYYLVG